MSTQLDDAPVVVSDSDTELDVPYNVFLWNDPITPMNVVTRALKKIFGIGPEKAEELMLTAHNNGKVVVWTGEREQAESYCIQLHTHGLQASVGKDS
jgi:ATP-dependent Clp protease adaptor protein ClpS